MGALHAGHISLLHQSLMENSKTCVSIFVNPLQFNDPEDIQKYPDTFDDDLHTLEINGCDMVFTGSLSQFFTELDNIATITMLDPGPYAKGLEGTYRPGHLDGVVTIVDRLFRTVGCCRAYFGEKDYQQTLVVRHLAKSLENEQISIRIVTCPTVRESDGLAMSSRNLLMSDEGRNIAVKIYRALISGQSAWFTGVRSKLLLEQAVKNNLSHSRIQVEYIAVVDPQHWNSPYQELASARGFVAAYIDGVRLIDNLDFDVSVK